jgi:acetyl esterase/lipase
MAQVETSAFERQMQLFASLQAAAPGPRPRADYPDVVSYYDLTYASVPGFRPLVLDLHVPATGSDFPVLLWVHGGGWQGGFRAMGQALELVQHGYAVAATQYRLSGEAVYPAQLHDLKGTVRWLRANASRFGLDSTHVAAWGASAGGHLVSLLGLTNDRADLEGEVGGNLEQSSAVQAVVAYFPVTDFFAMAGTRAPRPGPNPVTGLLGYAADERPDDARHAMPMTHVRGDAPPFLLVHGDADPLVPHTQSEALDTALRAAGAESTLVTLPGALHEDLAFWSDETLGQVREFLGRTLR